MRLFSRRIGYVKPHAAWLALQSRLKAQLRRSSDKDAKWERGAGQAPKSAAVPATVSGERFRQHATAPEGGGKAADAQGPAKPGDLPPHVARSPAGTSRTNRRSPQQRRGRPRAFTGAPLVAV
ncbi:MAG: hypothetical protein BroJett013_08930 [Alphaproteobacteria bacterium]|nr:MAG: hypothetical protein BroJett013_08930 [Alphaproteobacteria bacterium]